MCVRILLDLGTLVTTRECAVPWPARKGRARQKSVTVGEGHPPVSWPSSWQPLLRESSPPFIILLGRDQE